MQSAIVGPLRPFTDSFHGYIEADGQQIRVAAIACEEQTTMLLSLVAPKVSLVALFGLINMGKNSDGRHGTAYFAPNPELNWQGPIKINRPNVKVRFGTYPIKGITGEWHGLLWTTQADLQALELTPNLPLLKEVEVRPYEIDPATKKPKTKLVPVTETHPPRYIFAQAEQHQPSLDTWLLLLNSVGLPCTPGQGPLLWSMALEHELVKPMHAAGVRAWSMVGHPDRWSELYLQGHVQLREVL